MRITAVQTGPISERPSEAVRRSFRLLDDARDSDLVVFPELFSLPFWCVGLSDHEYFRWAEDLDGETLTVAREEVQKRSCYAVVPFFERGQVEGHYFNSAAVIGPDGSLISGRLPSGEVTSVYRKNAISAYNWNGALNDEKYYFRPGAGYPTFATEVGHIGVLICYDRWFSEAWRLLALSGAEVVCVPTASSGRGSDLFVSSLRTWSAQNVVFSVAANRAGAENVRDRTTSYFGLSCIASPSGRLLAKADGELSAVASAEVDLEEIETARFDLTMYRDRRPELYGPLTDP